MIRLAKDLSTDQKLAIESLLGRSLSEDEKISIRTVPVPPAPEWLQDIHQDARRKGLDALTMEEIDAEIAAARRERRERGQRARHTLRPEGPGRLYS
jgi:hypothetical protein